MTFQGIQTGALPGPPFLPIASQNVKMTIEQAVSDLSIDAKAREILSTLSIEADTTSARFFSASNLDHLHQSILLGVHERTKKILQKQSEHDLVLIMRSAYMNNRRWDVAQLNSAVTDIAVDIIVTNLEMHDLAQAHEARATQVLDYGVSTNTTGTKFYERIK
jgi:hypothetical protein